MLIVRSGNTRTHGFVHRSRGAPASRMNKNLALCAATCLGMNLSLVNDKSYTSDSIGLETGFNAKVFGANQSKEPECGRLGVSFCG